MEYRHEIIDFGESIPVKFFVHQLGYSGLHWHNSLELLFVVSGTVNITVAGHIHTLAAGDVILINANDPHEFNADECIMAAVQIKLSMFDERVVRRSDLYFDCNSARSTACCPASTAGSTRACPGMQPAARWISTNTPSWRRTSS